MMWWRNEMTPKMSLVSLREQLKKGQGDQGGWRCCMCSSRVPGKDHTQEGQPRDGTHTLPCSLMAGLGCKSLPQSRVHPVSSSAYLENHSSRSQSCMRDELGRVMASSATIKGLSTHPLVALAALLHLQTGPMVLQGWCISVFSITISAGSGQREENGQLAWRKFSVSLAKPRRKKVPWSIPCPGIEGRAALAVPLHCTGPIPAVTTLHLCAPASGHFLPTLFSPPAGNKYALLFWLILCAHSYY